jgi:hypothetical protein
VHVMYVLEIHPETSEWVTGTACTQHSCWSLHKNCLITVCILTRNWTINCTDTITWCGIWIPAERSGTPQRVEWLMSYTGWSNYKQILLVRPPVLNFMKIRLVSNEDVACGEAGWRTGISKLIRGTFKTPYCELTLREMKWYGR